MRRTGDDFGRRIASLRLRMGTLGRLRDAVGLPRSGDLLPAQWRAIDARLRARSDALTKQLDAASQLPRGRKLNAALGQLELDLARAFAFFDTYMDVLTQRHAPDLGAMLSGCDALAADALRREHPALAVAAMPVVYCDRGFGAAVIREGIPLADDTPNPVPLIQMPYARLADKLLLTSILHEAGHQALARLSLRAPLAAAIRAALLAGGESTLVADLFALWSSEIGPDFWTFGCAGAAHAGGVKELLALPAREVFRVSAADPHPPPYLRVLAAFDWCRRAFGAGVWDEWEREWLELYPLDDADGEARRLLSAGRAALPKLTRALFTTRFRALGDRALPSLFDLDSLAPSRLAKVASVLRRGQDSGARPCRELAAFRQLRDAGETSDRDLDRRMATWLRALSPKRSPTPILATAR